MRKSILHRRSRLRIKKSFDLQLTSMLDMLVIIVVFLLKAYTTTNTNLNSSEKITLPSSSAEEVPPEAVNLIIEPSGIYFENVKVVEFKLPPGTVDIKPENATYEIDSRVLSDGGRRILPLYDAFVKSREKVEVLLSKAVWVKPINPNDPNSAKEASKPKFEGTLMIQADKKVRYELLRKIMYTAGAAQYKIFKLITIKKET